jgi:tyrosinase
MVRAITLRGLYALFVSISFLSALCAADAVGDLQTKGRAALDAQLAKSKTCTKEKLQVRREWSVKYSQLFIGLR